MQGGKPSPFDRNLGTKMAAKCAEKLIQQIKDSKLPDGECIVELVSFIGDDTLRLSLSGRLCCGVMQAVSTVPLRRLQR